MCLMYKMKPLDKNSTSVNNYSKGDMHCRNKYPVYSIEKVQLLLVYMYCV